MAAGSEEVQYRILMDAVKALEDLDKLKAKASSVDEVFDQVAVSILEFSQKMGMSVGAVEALFKGVIARAEEMRQKMELIRAEQPGAVFAPDQERLAGVSTPFPVMGDQVGFKEADARVKSIQAGLEQSATEAQKLDAGMSKAAEAAALLATYTKQGFQNLKFGNPQQTLASMESLKAGMVSIRTETGKTFEQIGADIQKNFKNVPKFAVTDAVKQLNAELSKVPTAAQKAGVALAQALKAPNISKTLSGLKFDPTDVNRAKASYQSLMQIIQRLSATTGAQFSQVGRAIREAFTNIPEGTVTRAVKELDAGLQKTEGSATRAAKGIDAVRIALGAIVAMIVFRVVEAVQSFFTTAIEGARQLELALYNVANAERLLSQQGLDVTAKDLKEIVSVVERLVPTISHVDMTNAVAGIALFTKDLGLSVDQITELSKAIAVLYVRNRAFGLTFEQVRSQVLTGLLTGRAQGIRDLGVSVSETTIRAEALRLGLVKTKEEFDGLSGEMEANVKAQSLVSVITRSTAGEMQNLGEYLDTNDAKIERNKAAWEDFAATVGRAFADLIPDVSGMLRTLQESTETSRLTKLFKEGTPLIQKFGLEYENIIKKLALGLRLTEKETNRVRDAIKSLGQERILELFPDTSAIKDENIRKFVESLIELKDTETSVIPATDGLANSLGNLDEALKSANFDDLQRDLANLYDKARDMERDFNEKMSDMSEDHLRDMARMRQDYERSVSDAIQDYNDQRADAEARYRLQELEAEARYQERLRQLREKFLYSLEDALRERDARQVLRLIREYNMEKTAAENEEKIRKESAARQHAEEMSRLKREMEQRLQQLAEEFQIKQQRAQQDYLTKKERETREHEEDMAELQEQIQERLDLFAAKLAEELGLRGTAAEDLRKLLNEYYGEGGAYDQLYDYSAASLQAKTAALLAALQAMYAQAQAIIPTNMGNPNMDDWWNDKPSFNPGDDWWNGMNHARGGSFMTTGPTLMRVGEAGREQVDIIPTKDMGKNGMGGSAQVLITLSDGLEGEIVDKSLESMSVVLEQVRRNR